MKKSLADQLQEKLGITRKTTAKEKSESLPPMQERFLEKGTVVYLPLTEEEGLKLTDGYDKRNKFAAIIGVLPDGTIIGSLLVNTHASTGSEKMDQCQYPLKKEDYSWLDYKSWLDCSRIVPIERAKVLGGKFCGKLNQTDFNLIVQCVKDTTLISNKIKKKYGLL